MPRRIDLGPNAEAFWARVIKSEVGCWLWSGKPHGHGYGSVPRSWSANLRTLRAARFSWTLHNGPIPAGLSVCHRCDVKLCVRPDHLFLGTQAENVADMIAKGRRGRCASEGETNGRAKLTAGDVSLIRDLHGIAGLGNRLLGRAFGVSGVMVGNIVRGKNWKAA